MAHTGFFSRSYFAAGALLSLTLIVAAPAIAKSKKSDKSAGSSGNVVATLDGHDITEEEVDAKIKPQLAAIENQVYTTRKAAAEQLADDYLFEKAAKSAGLTKQEYVKREIDDKVAAPTDEDMQKFYDEHKSQINQPIDKIKAPLADYLKNQKLADRRHEVIDLLRQGANFKLMLTPPRVEVVSDGAPAVGPKIAPITIVEFSDFQCPYCKSAETSIGEVRKKYGDKIRLVYLDFPLTFHKNAFKAAEAARCAEEQDKFWQFHDALFADQSKLDADALKATAAKLDLDKDKFNQCLDQDKPKAGIERSMSQGTTLGVSGTPAFFINGRLLNGAQPARAFEEVIDDELTHVSSK